MIHGACLCEFLKKKFNIVLHCVINTFPYCLVPEVFTDYVHLFAGFEYRIGGVMFRVLTSSAVDRGFKPKTIKFLFVTSPLSTALRRKSKYGLARNQDNVSEWGYMFIWGL